VRIESVLGDPSAMLRDRNAHLEMGCSSPRARRDGSVCGRARNGVMRCDVVAGRAVAGERQREKESDPRPSMGEVRKHRA